MNQTNRNRIVVGSTDVDYSQAPPLHRWPLKVVMFAVVATVLALVTIFYGISESRIREDNAKNIAKTNQTREKLGAVIYHKLATISPKDLRALAQRETAHDDPWGKKFSYTSVPGADEHFAISARTIDVRDNFGRLLEGTISRSGGKALVASTEGVQRSKEISISISSCYEVWVNIREGAEVLRPVSTGVTPDGRGVASMHSVVCTAIEKQENPANVIYGFSPQYSYLDILYSKAKFATHFKHCCFMRSPY